MLKYFRDLLYMYKGSFALVIYIYIYKCFFKVNVRAYRFRAKK